MRPILRAVGLISLILSAFSTSALAKSARTANRVSPEAIEQAQPQPGRAMSKDKVEPLTLKIQILLSRVHFSPGQIDGKDGENVEKALTAFAQAHQMRWSGRVTPPLWQALEQGAPQQLLTQYQIQTRDLDGSFLKHLPTKMEDMRHLHHLSYTSPREELAERFHVSEDVLTDLNPKASFDKPGTMITVPNVLDNPLPEKVSRIEVDKTAQTVEAFAGDGNLVAFYPATVGSTEKPAPSGTLKVVHVQKNPTYHYNPKYHFKGVHVHHRFTIAAGPNNPVGLIWIGLNGEGYGIHGTPDPSKISKTQSHGCVRLTNWDALQLGAAVSRGVPVEFVGHEPEHKSASR